MKNLTFLLLSLITLSVLSIESNLFGSAKPEKDIYSDYFDILQRENVDYFDNSDNNSNLGYEFNDETPSLGNPIKRQREQTISSLNELYDPSMLECKKCKMMLPTNEHKIHYELFHKNNLRTCLICEKTYSQPANYIQHIRSVHYDKKHSCEYCNKKYSNRKHLHEHMRLKHSDDIQNLKKALIKNRLELLRDL